MFSIKKGLFSSLLSFALLISFVFPLTVLGAETTEGTTETETTTSPTENINGDVGDPPSGENVQRNEEEIQIEAETPASVTGEVMQGNGTVVDYTTTGSKQFYTIVDSEQKTFYLIVDMDKTQNNVYFLKSITQSELEGVTTNTGTTEVTTPVEAPNVTEADAAVPTPPEDGNSGLGFGVSVLVIAVIGVAAYYFLVMRKRHQQNQIQPNENEDDLEESYEDDFYEDEDENEDEDDIEKREKGMNKH